MNLLVTILVTVVLFGLLITIHEFGHYIVARMSGVGIIEFSIGMGPKLFQKEGKYNLFSVRALPIGGYVRMVGEPGEENPDDLPFVIGKTSINEVSVWKRMLIVLAGPAMNVLLAFVLMFSLVASSEVIASTKVAVFMDNCTSNAPGGLHTDDVILEIEGKKIHCYAELSYKILSDGASPVDILVEREGNEVLLRDVVFAHTEENGVAFGAQDFKVYRKEKTLQNVLYESFWQGCSTVYMTIDSMIDTFAGKYGIDAVGGPVAIGEEVGETLEAADGFADALRSVGSLTVMVSVSLGICNLLPLPALDGGRFLIYLLEAIRRKPLKKKTEELLTGGCMILLFILMALVFLKDIIHLF